MNAQASQAHVNYIQNHPMYTEDPNTSQSMLAPHRVIPYHYKGFNQDKQDAIIQERNSQVQNRKMREEMEKEEERLWALQ